MIVIELREKAGVEKFFVDKVSAKSAKRPKFDEMINFLREGDELIVSEFSRLARSTIDLLNIVETKSNTPIILDSLKKSFDFVVYQECRQLLRVLQDIYEELARISFVSSSIAVSEL